MGRKKKYPNAAARQKAFRLRHGQKSRVPLEIRKGEKLGAQETDLRPKRDGESWQEYHSYIRTSVERARHRQKGVVMPQSEVGDGEDSKGAKRSAGGYKEPQMSEEYYELRCKYEKDLEELDKKGRMKKK